MYAVKCYEYDGTQFGETDYFDNFDEAYEFASEMGDIDYLVDIITPNGRTICVN